MANIEGYINDLRNLVLQLHRSAGQLDDILRSIETSNETDPYYAICYIKSLITYREEMKRFAGFNNFDEQEEILWQKLISELKKESP